MGQLGAANSATGQFGAGPTRRGRFGTGTFRRSVSNGDINFQAELQIDHPTLWKFIDGLKKVQKGRDLFHEQLVVGHAPPRKLRRYRLCDETIQRIVQSYANYGIMDYLREA